jgi:hypothetical protein
MPAAPCGHQRRRIYSCCKQEQTAKRTLTMAVLSVWNSLLDFIHLNDSIPTFKRKLAAYLYTTAFN